MGTNPRRKTVTSLRKMKADGPKIVMITAYDATFARLFDDAVDMILVGDSLGMVIQGRDDTLGVTLDDMIYHGRAVARGAQRAHVTLDMPFMSYQVGPTQALESAGRLIKEGGGQSVKLEGGVTVAPAVEKIVAAGIPVVGHVGLTPQSVHAMGGFKVQGRKDDDAQRILEDAQALEQAGCFSIVLEGIPAELAKRITAEVSVPTIGIGAGSACDGQVLVGYDLLGMNADFQPKFLKTYASLHDTIKDAVKRYAEEVRSGAFPTDEHSFHSEQKTVPLPKAGYGAE